MALQFSETAPGVHTTTIVDPKTERRHNVAIIESCDAWQLFIDGELKTRDLPSFKAAVTAAQAQIAARRPSSMIRVAAALVAVSAAGVATVGLSKAIAPQFNSQAAVAKVASDTKSTEFARHFTRVTARPKVAAAKAAPANTIAAPRTAQASINETVVSVGSPAPPAARPGTAIKPVETVKPTAPTIASSNETETSGSETAPMGLRPLPMPAPRQPKAETPPTLEPAQVPELAPVVIKPKAAPLSPATPAEKRNEPAADNGASPSLPTEPLPTASPEADIETPPLPATAPVATAPLIRSASAPIDTGRLNSILADIEEEANEAEYAPKVSRPKPAPHFIMKRAPKRKKVAAKRSRRIKKRSRQIRRNRHIRRKPVYAAHVLRLPPQRRMTCFAHTCRFR